MNVEMRAWIGRWTSAGLGLALAIPPGLGADGQPGTEPLPIKRFECGMAVATCFSRGQVLNDGNTAQCLPRPSLPEGYVVGIMDLRNPAGNGATPLANWLPSMTHNETGAPQHQWRASNLGEVFGIALDNQSPPNIYVAATSIYPGEYYPSTGGPGSVYRIDGTTFQISTLITFKNVGSISLGNLCFDPDHNQLLVADLDNGLIRRVSMVGVELSTFDHGVSGRASASLPVIPDSSPFQRLTDAGRRVFAVQYHQGRVYYSVWGNVPGAGPGPGANTIWSVALLPNGDFATGPNAARVEVTPAQLPWNPSTGVTLAPNPATQASVVTDIAFSADGRMGTAERGLCFDDTRNLNTFAHYSPAREFVPAGTGWTDVTAPNGMRIGNSNPGHNSEGGLDYDCLRQVYVTGDLYVPNAPNPPYIYGIQILPSATNAFNTSYLVDLDGSVANYDKSYLGDVEVYRCCDCVKFSEETVQCLSGNQFQWTFCMTNTGTITNGHLVFLDLPPGVTVSPAIVDLVPPVKPGQGICTNVVFTLPADMEVGELCFRVAVHTPDYSDCCVVTKCLKLSSCCATIKEEKVICSQDGSGSLVWNFTLHNISGQPIKYLYLDAQPGCITPKFQVLTLNPPLANNQTLTTNITFASTNRCPQVCFRVSLLDSNIVNCCTFRHCIKLPDCVGVIDVVKPGDLQPDELKISPDSPTILTTLAPVNIPLSLLPSQADVQEVALLVDGVRVAHTATHAKSLRLGTLRPGAYELTLETTDSSGAIRVSAPMILLVQPELTPGVLEAESVTGGVELRIQTIAGEKCWVESATSLDPETWKTEETLMGDGKVRRQKVPLSDGKARFFRVRMQ